MKLHSPTIKTTSQPASQQQNKTEAGVGDVALKSDPPVMFQASLSVGSPDDPFEQEADKVSRQVMQNYDQVSSIQRKLSFLGMQTSNQPMMIDTRISRKLQRTLFRTPFVQSKCEKCEEEEKMQKKSNRIQFDGDGAMVSPQMESNIQSQRGSRHTMDPVTLATMESSFGADFSSVKIHTDSSAVQMSRDLNAHAFTVGNDIFFNEGRYQPQTKEGAGLLAHELTHTVQQGASIQNKRMSSPSLLSSLSAHTVAHLSAMSGSAPGISRKEMAQLEKLPEGEIKKVQQLQMLQMKGVDEIQKKSNPGIMRMCNGGGSKKAKLKSGPTYNPNGNLTPAAGGSGKQVSFDLSAEFENDPANGVEPSRGEIRQDIKWDAAMAASFASTKGVPHNGFPDNHPPDTWIEDRSSGDTLRLGHRTGKFARDLPVNKFVDSSGASKMTTGVKYIGNDKPSMLNTDTGTMFFRFYAIDICNGNNIIGGTDTITIEWG